MWQNGTTPYELAKRLGFVQISQFLLNHDKCQQNKRQLGDWLSNIGMMEYTERFQQVGFEDVQFLLTNGLSDATLDLMNVIKPGHRLKLQTLYQLKEFLGMEGESGEDDGESVSVRGTTSGEEGSEVPLEDDNTSESDED